MDLSHRIYISPPVLSEGFETVAVCQQCVSLTRDYKANDVVVLVPLKNRNLLTFDLLNGEFSKNKKCK